MTSFATEEMAQAVGMNAEEWKSLVERLERLPSIEELQMIGVQWSEHCSYKSSKRFLKKLITSGGAVVQGPGENAGLIRLDERRLIAFKIESHNHPSFVEPFQGAATGVGGILRDIFTMGARPIALGNYLRFGNLKDPKHQYLMSGVVSGISHYGNCVGIPTLGGQLHFDISYMGNILVNVFALGIVHQDEVFLSNTAKPGQSVMIWGAKTGRDGIHGASLLASADFEEDNAKKKEQKIRVQVGDPFREKCVMEATLECMKELKSKIGAIQDMGAAGLTCSTLEISEKSGVGMKVDLDKVPQREEGMQAFEILLSESQERMLACVEKGSEEYFKKILSRWECEAEVIGETTSDGLLKIQFQGEQVVNLPVSRLMEPPPAQLPEPKTSAPLFEKASGTDYSDIPDVREEVFVLKTLLSEPRIASKRSVFERYDSSVGASSVWGPGEAEAAVVWVGDSYAPHLGIAFKGACDESFAAIDPREAAKHAMAECYRSICCVGGRPLAITDGVNLGNPNTEEVQTELFETIEGINEAIEVFETPCIGGNVSLYNQTLKAEQKINIDPSTFIVMVGTVQDVQKSKPSQFQKEGSEVWLLDASSQPEDFPFGSLYARKFISEEAAHKKLPYLNLKEEKKLAAALLDAHESDLFRSLRDIGDGGLAIAIAEACFQDNKKFGFEGDWSKSQGRRDVLLFGEAGGRVIVEIDPAKRAELMKLGLKHRLELKRLGSVTHEDRFRIRPLLSCSMSELFEIWSGAFRGVFS